MTRILAVSAQTLGQAAQVLRRGDLVAFPTETVYGLGADAGNDRAVARIYQAKGRPSFNPLIVHVSSLAEADSLVEVTSQARVLLESAWPGPLTVVLRRRSQARLSRLVSAGLETVAIRCPAHPVALDLLRVYGCPVAAPSANRSGSISPTLPRHVMESLGGHVDIILDRGACPVGVESSIVDLSSSVPTLLRPGGMAREDIESVLGCSVIIATGTPDAPKSPGQLLSHYAPSLPVRLNAEQAQPEEALLGFGPAPGATLNLSETGDLVEAAANLFAMLHELDRGAYRGIAVMPVPHHGLGLAINDRLQRAAAPKMKGSAA